MARVHEVTAREELAPEHQPIFDEIAASRGRISGPFPVLLNSPEMALQVARIGHHVRFNHHFEQWVFELVVLTAAREADCLFEWAAHSRDAAKAGIRPEVIAAIRDRTAPSGLNEQESLLFTFVQQLVRRHRVDQQTFDAVKSWLGDDGVIELAATVGYYSLLACVMNAVEVQPPPDADRLPVP
jgi:4-carboxymuconolactone decarboxylase